MVWVIWRFGGRGRLRRCRRFGGLGGEDIEDSGGGRTMVSKSMTAVDVISVGF